MALIGQPNVGKSTLMNHFIGQKISITSRRPHTTRHRINGIKTTASAQIIFVDSPGMDRVERRAMNRYLNRTANMSLVGVDVVVWVKDSLNWQSFDQEIIKKLENARVPVILAINKIDRIKDKAALLPFLHNAKSKFPFHALVPISALKKRNINQLEEQIILLLPEGDTIYSEDLVTDRSERFQAAEMIREKLTRRLSQELPHSLTVEIERFSEEESSLVRINAIIWVERDGQKLIVIGKQGDNLKFIGKQARIDMERMLGKKVFLELWVKVKKGWTENERLLQRLGYDGKK